MNPLANPIDTLHYLWALIKSYFTKKPKYLFVEQTDYVGTWYLTKKLSDSGVYISVEGSASREKDMAYASFIYHTKGRVQVQPPEYTILVTSDDID